MSLLGKGLRIKKREIFDINRKVIAHATQKSWNEIPHVSYLYEPDVTEFFDYFRKNKESMSSKATISFNTLMLKVISEGLKASPELNATLYFHPQRKLGSHNICDEVSIALPWLLEDGRMITPIVKDVGRKTLVEITQYIDDIARRIKNTDIDAMQYTVGFEETLDEVLHGKLGVFRQIFWAKFGKDKLRKPTAEQKKAYKAVPDQDKLTSKDIFDASVLVSNIGSVFKTQKGALTMLEIIAPQVFVVGLNAIQDRPGVFVNTKGEKEIGIRKILPLCLTFDHRAADFANLIPFQNRLDEIFTNPSVIKTW